MSVFKKGNNKWYYRFQLNGKEYYRACKGAVDQKTALQYEAIVKAEIMKGNLGILDNKPKPTLKGAIKIYLEYSEVNTSAVSIAVSSGSSTSVEDFSCTV